MNPAGLIGMLIISAWKPSTSHGASCCNVPTVWTLKNLDKAPVQLTCSLEKSSAWTGKPISVTIPSLASGESQEYRWDSVWYSDGMGLIPGTWLCQSISEKNSSKNPPKLTFSTDWGENIHIAWSSAKASVARHQKHSK